MTPFQDTFADLPIKPRDAFTGHPPTNSFSPILGTTNSNNMGEHRQQKLYTREPAHLDTPGILSAGLQEVIDANQAL
ncbi:hypothetical protein N7471_010537 [Penicillium samsonianum]|uniref:uncharacterized protein n=1 Tax=Penicillium samsonianum TaxID=1882272 RepID=UPI002547448A|nr:uncharacterized protein N7471_010537 [Penicillium samsonianum]KAJ6126044.1 hypothetical protein N7471_010537 [Penicillium samsonianum]